MKQTMKQSYGSISKWLSHLMFSLFIAAVVHLSLSGIKIFNDGFDLAYLSLRSDIASEEIALLGFHPIITSQLSLQLKNLEEKVLEQKKTITAKGETVLEKHHLQASDNTLNKVSEGLNTAMSGIKRSVLLLLSVAQLLFYKCIVFVFALPLLLLSTVIGSIDGMIHRAVRTEEMGRESSFLFHKFSSLSAKVVSLAMTIYFILPISLGLFVFLFPMSLLACVLASVTTRHLKKYL